MDREPRRDALEQRTAVVQAAGGTQRDQIAQGLVEPGIGARLDHRPALQLSKRRNQPRGDQARLAYAGRAEHNRERLCLDLVAECRDDPRTAEESVTLCGAIWLQALVGARGQR
jgi:hypothetical protein